MRDNHGKSRLRRFWSAILLAILLASVCVPAGAVDHQSGGLKTVRVGYLIYEGYQEGEGDAPKAGYGYEYLQKIAYYAGWQYEYVNGSFSQLLDMLKAGEIDIMGNISYTEERAQEISYSAEEQGREFYYLFVREDRTDITASDPSTLQGARVGINKGSVQVDLFEAWCREKGVQCDVILYESSADRYADMNNGRLDATVSTAVAEKEIARYRWNAIVKVGYSPYYFAVNRRRPDLLEELNAATARVLQSDWYYNERVYLKYNGKLSASSAGLTAADQKWLEQKGAMKVGYTDNALPFADWDVDRGGLIGLLPTFIDHVYQRYDVELEPVRFDNYAQMYMALEWGEIDAIFPAYGSYWIAEENDLMVTEPLATSYLMMIYRGSYREDTPSVIAVTDTSPMQRFYVQEHYPEAEIVQYASMDACMDAVASGAATCTLMCADTYYAYRNEFDKLNELTISNTGYQVYICFATRKDDIQMYTFLQKALASQDEAEIQGAMIAGEYANPEMSVKQFLQKHVMLVLAVAGTVVALVLGFLVYYVVSTRRTTRLSRSNDELSEKAYIDLATGLPNKNKCKELTSAPYAVAKPTACYMLDLNDLKKVNDTLGHEMGDLMILNFARLLRKIVPNQYFVGRFGGDEFIVIAQGISGRAEAEMLVERIREIVLDFNGANGDFHLTYACGFALSEEHPGYSLADLLNEADKLMYEDKARVKGMRKQE